MHTTVVTYNTHFDGEVFLEERNNIWNMLFLFNGKELDEETGLFGFIGGGMGVSGTVLLIPLDEKYVTD